LKSNKGFTLTEIIVVLVILAILAAFTIPAMLGYVAVSKEKLCNVTRLDMERLYKTSLIGKESSVSNSGFEAFVKENWGSLSQCPDGGVYIYKASVGSNGNIDTEILCSKHSSVSVLTGDQVSMFRYDNGWGIDIITSYTGTDKDIVIPKSLNINGKDIIVSQIYQDAFEKKDLTSITFGNDSKISRIHARAFKNNNLTEINLPDSIKDLDYGAFMDNNITKITIGSNVVMEGHVFGNNDDFKNIYITGAGGAGTYLFVEGKGWIKQ